MSTHHIEIFPIADAGFVCGFPGIPPNAGAEHGARIEGEVHITLPFLGVPASAVNIEFQKSESISTDGQSAITSVEKLEEIVLWTGKKSSNVYSRRFPFSIEIPENLPPTITLDKPGLEVHIRYLLHATVYRENRIKFWSDKPFMCTVPVTIIKYEHHPAWPIYHHPKPKHTSNGSMSFTAKPMRSCFSPGETIRLVSELSFGSYSVIPRRINFEARLLQLVMTLESDQQPHHDAPLKKQPTTVLISHHSTSSPRLDHATTLTVELTCPIPINGVDPTLIYKSRIQVSHILEVTAVIHAEHLQIDIPVIISTFASHSLTVAQDRESMTDPRSLFRNIGDVLSLGGSPNFENLSQDLQLQTHSTVSEPIQRPITESEGEKDVLSLSIDTMPHTIVDDRSTPTEFHSSPTLSSELDCSRIKSKVRLRKSGVINTSDDLEFDADSLVRLNQEISAGWSEFEGSFMLGLFGETSKSSSVDLLELLGYLTDILQSPKKTKALLELRGDRAQVVIELLNSVLIALDLYKIQVRRRIFITLRCLCEASQCYPVCDTLHNVIIGPREGAGTFCDIYRGRHRDQVLCLKVIHLARERNNKAMLKSFLQEAILWSQLDHRNILPFYGIYYLGPERKMCLVSPWLENGNLINYLQENPTVSRRPFILDVATGLKYLHDKDVIHGDLKSTNVLITSFGRACITDFGLSLARAEASAESLVDKTNSESYRWLAPELLVGLNSYPSRASDIWAFGCLCYQILTRRVPFYEICSETAVINIVLKGEIPSQKQNCYPASAIDAIDNKMWSLLKHCWSFKPDNRPTCRHITDLLEIKECIDHRSGLAYDQIVRFKIAMREGINLSFHLKDILCLFDDIDRIGG